MNVTQKPIQFHLVEGKMIPGQEIGLKIDRFLTQDATGTMVMLELEALGIDRVKTEISAQYVDHNLLQTDYKNADDHLFLRSACQRFGIWYSRPGNGVSHPLHMERFDMLGKTPIGSDSHTPAAGSIAPKYLGQVAVLAKSYARIRWRNLVNFGIMPLEFVNPDDYDTIDRDDEIEIIGLRDALTSGQAIVAKNKTKNLVYEMTHSISPRQINILLHGGVINEFRGKLSDRQDLSEDPSISAKQESLADKQDVLG
ncbi:hypothetical protein H6G17_09890 [Chroococcidiopsis sp. FACHB-1243]|nr:hypothetical protein [Chroococcidiopsis sp. [FACHB-1243]]